MSTFSNDTGEDISKDGLGAVREPRQTGARYGRPYLRSFRSASCCPSGNRGLYGARYFNRS